MLLFVKGGQARREREVVVEPPYLNRIFSSWAVQAPLTAGTHLGVLPQPWTFRFNCSTAMPLKTWPWDSLAPQADCCSTFPLLFSLQGSPFVQSDVGAP